MGSRIPHDWVRLQRQLMSQENTHSLPTDRERTPISLVLASVRAMRPHQWVKNGFVLAPLVFSKELGNLNQSVLAFSAALAFCGASSGVYLLNDLLDIEADRLHPKKRLRPLASGELPIPLGWGLAVSLMVGAVLFSLLRIGIPTAVITSLYVLLNVAYTLSLKHKAYIDAICIATGFCLRLAAGSYATEIPVSVYLWCVTGLLALYLAFGKRYHELRQEARQARQRRALHGYSEKVLRVLLMSCGLCVILAYGAYTLSPRAGRELGTPFLFLTNPFVIFGMVRFFMLVRRANPEPPTDAMLKDLSFVINGLLWCAVMIVLLFLV